MKKISFILVYIFFSSYVYLSIANNDTIYVAPGGSGDGSSESSPLGSLSDAVEKLSPGDVMMLLDGEYLQTLKMTNVHGTLTDPITIKSKNICEAFINANAFRSSAIEIKDCSYLHFDGLKAGNATHTVFGVNSSEYIKITRCAAFNAGYHVARDGGVVQNTYADNCHIFGIAYSKNILSEDVWAWGTGRYNFLYFQSEDCILRRGVFRPTDQELGYGYDRCPHSGFNIYDCDNSIAENCIAFETRVHPESTHNEGNPWGLVQGGMVFDDHTLPSGFNYVYGCFDLDNGQWRSEVPRSNSAVHLMSKWSGKLEDVVIWKNAHDYKIIKNTTGTVEMPERALIGSPSSIKQNTVVDSNMNHRYMNGELTDIPLWPWPYEDIIKVQMGMDETMTEYVTRMVDGFVEINPVSAVKVNGFSLDNDSIMVKDGSEKQLNAAFTPENATNTYIHWISLDGDVARVDNNGLVTGIKPGVAAIIARTDDGGLKDTCHVMVNPVNVTDVSLSSDSISLETGLEKQLNATVIPENASNKNIQWVSSDVEIATVDDDGWITGISQGTANVIVTTEDGSLSDTCTIHVFVNVIAVSGISLDTNQIELVEGDSNQLSAAIEPVDASDNTVYWFSSDTSTVRVNEWGLVTAIAVGSGKIIVRTEDGDYTDTCSVVVHQLVSDLKNTLKNKPRIYPNPASSDFTIELSGDMKATVKILDISGKPLFQGYTENSKLNIPGGFLQQGIYVVIVQSDKAAVSKQLVII